MHTVINSLEEGWCKNILNQKKKKKKSNMLMWQIEIDILKVYIATNIFSQSMSKVK